MSSHANQALESILRFYNSMNARDSLGGEENDLNSFLMNSRSVEVYIFLFSVKYVKVGPANLHFIYCMVISGDHF